METKTETKVDIAMAINKLANFAEACAENLPGSISEILQAGGGRKPAPLVL